MKAGTGQNVSQSVVVNVQTKETEASEKVQEIVHKKTRERLEELNELQDSGLITVEEYEEKRRDILSRA